MRLSRLFQIISERFLMALRSLVRRCGVIRRFSTRGTSKTESTCLTMKILYHPSTGQKKFIALRFLFSDVERYHMCPRFEGHLSWDTTRVMLIFIDVRFIVVYRRRVCQCCSISNDLDRQNRCVNRNEGSR